MNKQDFDKIDERLKSITEQTVEQIEIKSDLPPTIEQLEDNNKTYAIMAAILFIDIRKSTYLTENSQAKSMVKIYRAFMRMAVDCVRKNGGVTRQFLGDRIMGVFIDSKNENEEVTEKAVDKAINAARSLQTVIDYSLNKHLKNNVNGKIIECGIGIDYGRVLVTQVGMYGVESDTNKENEVDCVWVGNTTNHASKYSDLAAGGEIFISNSVYKGLSEEYKEVWTESAKYKGSKLFQGYVTSAYYMDFTEELGHPIKVEDDSTSGRDTSQQLADGIKEIETLQNKLIQRERELAVLEEKIKKENQELNRKYNIEYSAKVEAVEKKNKAEENLKSVLITYYNFINTLIDKSFCYKYDFIEKIGLDYWKEIIQKLYLAGVAIGLSMDEIKTRAHSLVDVYGFYDMQEEAYDIMVAMARNSEVWISWRDSAVQWACKNSVSWKLIDAIETRLKNDSIPYDKRESFKDYIVKVKKIRGY
ncbi:Adenylate cyclase, class 3 [Anaerocolumna jejuensis DSM 15929]|uniref:Adenylate cyclase, class 3 n=1 Tax=Anaerocolumna jejuensis DSM 15929 TaxID=1121322 RepID=A0A1M6KJS1_9FIRM|nr:adenylate/guanylate cyclase domain-containing protein [Anaerocolumna jejuensis]SHJ59227.1 Adenylate cyclase, class 3 [Anaerocolumna jejuensis DSM 15929]